MSWSLFPFSLEGDRSHDLPVVQNLDFCLIGIPPRYIYLILIYIMVLLMGGLAAPWLDA